MLLGNECQVLLVQRATTTGVIQDKTKSSSALTFSFCVLLLLLLSDHATSVPNTGNPTLSYPKPQPVTPA